MIFINTLKQSKERNNSAFTPKLKQNITKLFNITSLEEIRAPLVAQMVKNLPSVQETQFQSLGWEDPLEKGMDAHSSILTWRIPWTKKPGRLQSMESQRVRHNWVTKHSTAVPVQGALCDPMDCGPPGSSVHGILQARILGWVVIPFPRGSSWPRDWTQVSCIAGRFFTAWAIREDHRLH